ncbi:TPA: aconitate hydratase AcnA [Elizabethkingia anophelis]|uniref:aconitate hydratase AcnA n=1 Tax=Elizabethkingia anophelis TaxID=1117645 RepID=UPI0016299650|nr:aconitate hydratase AcnA [Elizabethkingia anophelis]MCT3671762.1 aconitate hydratase AcnA [Elizabethkingia anophelis]MCT3679267.1 aconitate hydratase AcnA [Elizabethkingia anophelis]MCT3703172.1 aconitate hydratase AcnA [Elizabethkingia anophelis]MCT3769429.1 aconitate hydratase AcnA [Elizabethkingia anophelis]MCT3779397.1 aconitate hydratase AcnA [Elizabethkingia anophelis]
MNTQKSKSVQELSVNGKNYHYSSLKNLSEKGVDHLPFSIRILLENVLRNYDGFSITDEHVDTLLQWTPAPVDKDIPFKPARILMQDFTGVPAVVDMASLRAEFVRQGKDGQKINPAIPVDLVIDHSVQVDYFGTDYSYDKNVTLEFDRNKERYELLKWAQKGLNNFTVVPPGMGICHQVNLEYLAKGVIDRDGWLFPDTLVGTDSHTPMVNGIGVIAWGVGGIEAEAAMLGQPIFFTCPEVVGLKLTGKIPPHCTATDMVLSITRILRDKGVVGKFVEVFGDGLDNLTVTDRATISNMSPEFGCTVTYFPIDDRTLEYMHATNRSPEQIKIVEEYCKENLLWRTGNEDILYSSVVELDLNTLEPTVSGPKRPQDKILVKDLSHKFTEILKDEHHRDYEPISKRTEYAWLSDGGSGTEFTFGKVPIEGPSHSEVIQDTLHTVRIKQNNSEFVLSDGSIVIAAITSCTNTSNPAVMVGAGLLARNAIEKGLRTKPWVKTSLAPGSKVVTKYLERSGLNTDLEALRFHTVGYGCTSCIGNSGPLPPAIATAVDKGELVVASVLSGNRNFEARVHPQVKMNFLMSPMLVVAYALTGHVDIDLTTEPLQYDPNGEPVYLKDIWPSREEIQKTINECLKQGDFEEVYDVIFDGSEDWQNLEVNLDQNFEWDQNSTYIKEAPFFENISADPDPVTDIKDARVLLYLGDSVTTDHISPAGSFKEDSAAGAYLKNNNVNKEDFNSYGSRRGNHEVMMRGTFANVRIKNKIAGKEGGFSRYFPTNEVKTVFDTAMAYEKDHTPLIILAGKEYGSGSSRDWAAKGTFLLGVRAVIAESFERIHRSNLVGMGVAPLVFTDGQNAESLGLDGTETYSISGLAENLTPHKILEVKAVHPSGKETNFKVKARLDSAIEIEYYRHQGILQYVLREYLKNN